jgi:hypothetical protein
MEYINVLPINDIQTHSHHALCSCNPKVETTPEGDFLIIHNAFDGRDLEEARREIYKN